MESLPSVRCLFVIICVLFGVRMTADVFAQEAPSQGDEPAGCKGVPYGKDGCGIKVKTPDKTEKAVKWVKAKSMYVPVLVPLPPKKAPMRVVCEIEGAGYVCHMVEDANVSCVFYEQCRTKLLQALKRDEACPGYFVCKSGQLK